MSRMLLLMLNHSVRENAVELGAWVLYTGVYLHPLHTEGCNFLHYYEEIISKAQNGLLPNLYAITPPKWYYMHRVYLCHVRTMSARWLGGARSHVPVLPARQSSVARSEGGNVKGTLPEDRRHQTCNSNWRTVCRSSWYVLLFFLFSHYHYWGLLTSSWRKWLDTVQYNTWFIECHGAIASEVLADR